MSVRVPALPRPIGPAMAVAVWLGYAAGGPWLAVAVSVAGTLVAGELYARARAAGLRPQALLGLVSIPLFAIVGHIKADRASRALVGVACALVIATFGEMLVRTDRRRLIETVLSSVVPAIAISLPVGYLAAMRQLPEGDRLVGALLVVVVTAEAGARLLARLTGVGIGGSAAGPSRAAGVRLVGAALGAALGAVLALSFFDPAISGSYATLVAAIGGLAVGVSQPVATLLEAVTVPEPLSPPTSVLRITSGLWLAAPFAFYGFLLLSR